jgi:dihydropyrimidinase
VYDLVIQGGTVVTVAKTLQANVAISGEAIAAIGPTGAFVDDAAETIDATGCLVLPGGVDPHCHYNLPFEQLHSEPQDYSYAAALGGTTTVIDFAVQEPPKSLTEAVSEKKAESSGRMAVDYGLHAIVTGEVPFEVMEEIGDTIAGGIPSIKTFTTYGWMVDDGHRFGVMCEVARHGGISVVHAEDDAIANWLTKKYVRDGKTHGGYISETRGPLVEEAAIRRAMLLAEHAGSALYVLHMAAGAGVHALAEARARQLPFFGETLAGYLSFTSERLWDDEARGLLWNSFPTLKSEEDREVLWAALADDRIQLASSDHCAFSSTDRYQRMGTTIESLQAGQAAVELRLPVLYHLGVAGGRLTLERFVGVTSTNAAKIMGLYPRKGEVSVGSDADLVVLDPEQRWTVDHTQLHMSTDYSCWDGWELQGKVVTTILRGSVLVRDGNYVGSRTGGRFLPRTLDDSLITTPANLAFTRAAAAVETV